jgi:hypothetical protein
MGRRSLAAKLGVSQPRRRDNDRPEVPTAPVVPPAPGTLGLPAVQVGKPASPRAARLVRTLRTRWWPRFLLADVLLVVVGVTLLSGGAKAWVVGAGAAIIFVIGLRSLSMTPADYRLDPPMPSGAGYKPLVALVYSSRKARRC